MPTREEFAASITGREYPFRLSKDEIATAVAAGLVVIYGASDDLLEFEGAISDEVGANDGTTALIDRLGPLPNWESVKDEENEAAAEAYFRRKAAGPVVIEAVWTPEEPEASWLIKTTLPHATFDIMEVGDLFCRGVVIALADLPEPAVVDVAALRAEAAKSERRAIAFGDIVANHCIAMQAAVIDAALNDDGNKGMVWIRNTLRGPGHLPDIDEAEQMGGAQAWFDAKTAEHEAFRAAHPAP